MHKIQKLFILSTRSIEYEHFNAFNEQQKERTHSFNPKRTHSLSFEHIQFAKSSLYDIKIIIKETDVYTPFLNFIKPKQPSFTMIMTNIALPVSI